jgi:hypothetical protein
MQLYRITINSESQVEDHVETTIHYVRSNRKHRAILYAFQNAIEDVTGESDVVLRIPHPTNDTTVERGDYQHYIVEMDFLMDGWLYYHSATDKWYEIDVPHHAVQRDIFKFVPDNEVEQVPMERIVRLPFHIVGDDHNVPVATQHHTVHIPGKGTIVITPDDTTMYNPEWKRGSLYNSKIVLWKKKHPLVGTVRVPYRERGHSFYVVSGSVDVEEYGSYNIIKGVYAPDELRAKYLVAHQLQPAGQNRIRYESADGGFTIQDVGVYIQVYHAEETEPIDELSHVTFSWNEHVESLFTKLILKESDDEQE